MKKALMVLGLGLLATANAQSWDTENGKLTLAGCYGKQDGIYCDFNYVLTKKQVLDVRWDPDDFKVFKQDGTSQVADGAAFIDGKFGDGYYGSSTHEIIANVPVKLQLYFNIPASTTSFRAIAYEDNKFDNIPVRPLAAKSTTQPKLQTNFTVSGYNITLTNCKQQGKNYICQATAKPAQ